MASKGLGETAPLYDPETDGIAKSSQPPRRNPPHRLTSRLAPFGEEAAQKLGRLGLRRCPEDVGAMMAGRLRKNPRAVDDASAFCDLRRRKRAPSFVRCDRRSAHRAGLEGDPQGAIVEPRSVKPRGQQRGSPRSRHGQSGRDRRSHRVARFAMIASPRVTTAPTGTSPALRPRLQARARAAWGEEAGSSSPLRLAQHPSRSHIALLVELWLPAFAGLLDLERRHFHRRFGGSDLHRARFRHRTLALVRPLHVIPLSRRGDLGAWPPRIWLMSIKPVATPAITTRTAMIRMKMIARIGLELFGWSC